MWDMSKGERKRVHSTPSQLLSELTQGLGTPIELFSHNEGANNFSRDLQRPHATKTFA